jgi:hypothetical protein
MDISALEKQVAAAQEQYKQLMQRLGPGTLGEAIRAGELVANAQRELAEAKGEEHAIPYDVGFVPEAAVSEAVLLQTEYATVLTFSAVREMPDGKRASAGYGVVRIDRCTLTKFGHPNDEALAGHPLYSKGLNTYGVYEVRNSLWSRQTVEMNRVSFPNTPDSTQKHFIFTFHDSTFECLARGLRASLSMKPYSEILTEITKSVFERG